MQQEITPSASPRQPPPCPWRERRKCPRPACLRRPRSRARPFSGWCRRPLQSGSVNCAQRETPRRRALSPASPAWTVVRRIPVRRSWRAAGRGFREMARLRRKACAVSTTVRTSDPRLGFPRAFARLGAGPRRGPWCSQRCWGNAGENDRVARSSGAHRAVWLRVSRRRPQRPGQMRCCPRNAHP